MIGPAGLLMHMAGAAVVSAAAGIWWGAVLAAKGLYFRVQKRGLQCEWELISESDAAYQKRREEQVRQAIQLSEQMERERSK